jgi:hypothetical protein
MPFCALSLTSCGSGALGIGWQSASGELLPVSSAYGHGVVLSFSFIEKDRASSIDPNVHSRAHLHSMTAYRHAGSFGSADTFRSCLVIFASI